MIIETLLFIPLLVTNYYYKNTWPLTLLIFGAFYWIPKGLMIQNGLNRFFPMIETHRQSKDKKIALTFDDAPYGSSTRQIIEILDQYEMKATFFMISDYMTTDAYNMLANAVSDGHQIANHGATNSMHLLKTTDSLRNEITKCDNTIKVIYGMTNENLPKKFYRPGCGLFSNNMIKTVEELDYKIILGSVYPNDPVVRLSYLNYLYLKWHIEAGDIVILHDRKWTPGMLKYLLPWLKEKGLTSVKLDELIKN